MLKNIIKSTGLNEKEAAIYIACLKLGNTSVSDIAGTAQINRVTTYSILEKLLKKGFISRNKRNDTMFFEAIEPNFIYLQQKDQLEQFKQALPEFKKIARHHNHPMVRYFEGIEGVKAIYAETLSSQTEILSIANSADIRSLWPNYDHEYVEQRVIKKIFLRGIAMDDSIGQAVVNENKRYFRDIRLVPSHDFNLSNEINIYDNRIAYTSFGQNPMGTIIEDIDLANTQRYLFEMIWTTL